MPGDSHFWSCHMKVKEDFLRMDKFKLGDSSQVRFWEDVWVGSFAFKDLYPDLYNIATKKSATVVKVLENNQINIAFRRSLVSNNLLAWQQLIAAVSIVQLNDQKDMFIWSFQKSGLFSVRPMYMVLVMPNIVGHKHVMWSLKLPLKVKIFIWYLLKGVVLTKDNLTKRQWKGSTKCCSCNLHESIQHLFLLSHG